MKITWLGQAGLLFEVGGLTVVADPYLSDSVEKTEPENRRRVPIDGKFLEISPDIIILTHNHLDHTDPETLKHYLTDGKDVTVLASQNAWQNVRERFGGRHNYVLFNRGTRWSESGLSFTAVRAVHSDLYAVGFIMEAEGKKYYITGDTLYSDRIFTDLPDDINYVFLPVNGRGNNMNMLDARLFCEKIGVEAVPLHCGLFDGLDMNDWEYKNKAVPEFYKEIKLKGDNL